MEAFRVFVISALVMDAMYCLSISEPVGNQISIQNQPLKQAEASGNNLTNDSNTIEDSSGASQAELEQYWLNQRDHFFNLTSFTLPKVS